MNKIKHIITKGGPKTKLFWFLRVVFLLFLILYFLALPRRLFTVPYSVVVESSDGRLIGARIASDGQWRFPEADTVPEKFKKAVITFEDKRFFKHPGVDPLSLARAVRQNVSRGGVVSGASTLTMQVIRLSRGRTERSFGEKIKEALLATRLELSYSKEEILALYASHAPFGGNVVGLGAASWRYFGRPPQELSWAEAATLAVLPNSPSLIHVSRNREKLRVKRDFLLQKMFATGIISGQELELALGEPLPERPLPLPMTAPHLTDRIAREKGSVIAHTTIDHTLQAKINRIVADAAQVYSTNRVNNIAVLVAEVRTGRVLAYVGNVYRAGDGKNGSNVDVITAPRSSGSILKPFLYTAMIDEGDILPGTLVADVPFYYRSFSPKNFNRTFDGAVPAHRVLERSLNVPTVRMLQEYGIEKFHSQLKRLGFTTITRTPDNYGLTLILGGAECKLWDAVEVYAKLAGKMNMVADHTSQINRLRFYEDSQLPSVAPEDIPYGHAALWLTMQSLSDVNRPEEESEWRSFASSRRVAWKTGTSYGNRDAWSIGLTPDHVVGVWVGNANGEGRPNLTGINYAAPVMFDVFSLLPRSGWFVMPEVDMYQELVCRRSGHRATDLCDITDSLWIPLQGIETPQCPYHHSVTLSSDGRYRVNSDCAPIADMRRVSWFVLPAAQEWYYRLRNADYKPLPPMHPDCGGVSGESTMELIYPRSGMSVVIPRKLDSADSKVVLHAVHRDAGGEIYWHLDGDYLGTTRGEHRIAVNPPSGRHILTLVDSGGYSVRVGFTVEKE